MLQFSIFEGKGCCRLIVKLCIYTIYDYKLYIYPLKTPKYSEIDLTDLLFLGTVYSHLKENLHYVHKLRMTINFACSCLKNLKYTEIHLIDLLFFRTV